MLSREEHVPGRGNSRCRVPKGGVGEGVAACISLDQQEDQCDLSMTSDGRMVEETGLETRARL